MGVTPLSVTARTPGIPASRPTRSWYGENSGSRGYPLLDGSSVTSSKEARSKPKSWLRRFER
jgi:hypothetical protein